MSGTTDKFHFQRVTGQRRTAQLIYIRRMCQQSTGIAVKYACIGHKDFAPYGLFGGTTEEGGQCFRYSRRKTDGRPDAHGRNQIMTAAVTKPRQGIIFTEKSHFIGTVRIPFIRFKGCGKLRNAAVTDVRLYSEIPVSQKLRNSSHRFMFRKTYFGIGM